MNEQTQNKKTYKKTLNLPKTPFPMKANLAQNEPASQKRWAEQGLYKQLRERDYPRGPFVFHDGPPYANGPIHIGHLVNKVLKDLVVRSRTMLGYDTPYIPGWDCHGLPIEHKVVQDLGEKAKGMAPMQIRKRCHDSAAKFIKTQSKQMQRLLTLGDYDDPYLTMNPGYEGAEFDVFADLVSKGIVYRGLKPVHWSIENQTALADAELEYHDREDTSVFVLFEVANPEALPEDLDVRPGQPLSLMIWTTTPWTLPANMAVAVSPDAEYSVVRFDQGETNGITLVATDLAEQIFQTHGGAWESLGECTGQELVDAGVAYEHPFFKDQPCPVLAADYVTLEDGTGLVHTAPGHGADDYQTGLKHGISIYCPVRGDGTYDDTVPKWLRGKNVWDANDQIVEHLRESGHLYHDQQFSHSYPHDWRSKTPTIFRATEQWFVGVDQPYTIEGETTPARSLRQRALEAIEDVTFLPNWGRNRMRGMLESRPDWCLSRQRSWGVPIPAFFGPEEGQTLLTPATVRAVGNLVREQGTNVWFTAAPEELLANYDPATDPDAPDWLQSVSLNKLSKGQDIFDVWFDSGSSWNSVLRKRNMGFPADLYVEGSDQHRGWFQLSLLLALGVTGQAPFRTVLTHGFLVDKFGQKMSKSLGNAIEVEDLLKDFGADVCRWWVVSANTENDIKVDLEFFKTAGEEYRKVRNTVRFLLANLQDFDPNANSRPLTAADAHSLDAWAHGELQKLTRTVRENYERFDFRRVHEAIFHFCNETMSAVYLAAVKDRLYCDRPDSDRRRRTQTVMHEIADALIRLIAPILCHSADEAYLALHGRTTDDGTSVHTQLLPEPVETPAAEAWPEMMTLRDRVLKHLEDARAQRGIDNPLDAGIEVALPPEAYQKFDPFTPELADLCGVSRFELDEDGEETILIHDLSDEPRCERSWKRDGTVKQRSDEGWLSDRDAEAVGVS